MSSGSLRGGVLLEARGQGAARGGDEMMGATHMAGNPILRRLSVRARAWGSPCSCGSEEQPEELLKQFHAPGSRVPREVVRGGASDSADASDSSLDGALAPLTAEMLLPLT